MVFSSMIFLCVFLPVVCLLYFVLPGIRMKNVLLLAASLVFYAYGEPVYILLLAGSAFVNYLGACLIGKYRKQKKLLIFLVVAGNLGVLFTFKYLGFFAGLFAQLTGITVSVPEIRMPIGISFFTFQAMSYVIDVYRGKTEAQKNFGKVLLYISFFPQLIAGPIVKYHDIEQEIDSRSQTLEGCFCGIRRFIAGLCKKVLIANAMGSVADTLFTAAPAQVGWLGAWIGAVSYMLQIYFDFSGYSDMAIGLGWMFGFHFKENFQYPYVSASIQEFWRRWHISLSGWFKEYLYIPLGGNRKGRLRTVLNKLAVFFCTGIWHGASVNFVFWGLYHGCFLMLEEYVPAIRSRGGKIKAAFQHGYVLLVVCVGFVFFRAETMEQGIFWVTRMFTGVGNTAAAVSLALRQLTPAYLVMFATALLTSCPVVEWMRKRKGYEAVSMIGSMAGLILCMLSLAGGTYNPFIYFRF